MNWQFNLFKLSVMIVLSISSVNSWIMDVLLFILQHRKMKMWPSLHTFMITNKLQFIGPNIDSSTLWIRFPISCNILSQFEWSGFIFLPPPQCDRFCFKTYVQNNETDCNSKINMANLSAKIQCSYKIFCRFSFRLPFASRRPYWAKYTFHRFKLGQWALFCRKIWFFPIPPCFITYLIGRGT